MAELKIMTSLNNIISKIFNVSTNIQNRLRSINPEVPSRWTGDTHSLDDRDEYSSTLLSNLSSNAGGNTPRNSPTIPVKLPLFPTVPSIPNTGFNGSRNTPTMPVSPLPQPMTPAGLPRH